MPHGNSNKRSSLAQSYQSWYSCPRWRKLRRDFLRINHWCIECKKDGKKIVATVVDHKYPHKGDPIKFWSGPFQAMCTSHHNSFKQGCENRGYSGECDSDGWPTDSNHPVNRNAK